ncbi:MAG TPA: tetratricopeptide repeat protein [Verrucomicrobiae bacterium]|nr:tetratricopeptide repeat protein [Verrucomicrobiae bacterium]
MMRMLMVLLAGGLCLNTVAVSAASNQPSNAAEQSAREEVIRRQEAQLSARRLIDQAQKSYAAGDYQEAIGKLEQAVKLLPRAKMTESDRSHALRMLTDSYYRLSESALRTGDTAQARTMAEKALEFDPHNGSAEAIIVKVRKAETEAQGGVSGKAPALDTTPEFLAKKDEVKKLFREGRILMDSGQYDEAEQRFQQILLLDPYNTDASALLKSVAQTRMEIADTAADASRAHLLEQVEEAWVPPISHEIQAPKHELPATVDREAARQAALTEKLNKIIIPEVNYREAVVSDVITFLSEESRRLDPDRVGVNIVLSAGVSAPAVAPTPTPTPPAAGGAAENPPLPPTGAETQEGRKITLSLRDVPLIDALKYVTTLADLKYRIDPSAVIVLPTNAPSGDMITRSYPVNPGVFIPMMVLTNRGSAQQQTVQTGGGGSGATASAPLVQAGPSTVLPDTSIAVDSSNQIKQIFMNAGVDFPPGSAFFYYDRTSTIVIRNTPENLETFDRVLSVLNAVPAQVEIEAKFVEISQNDLDELGFQWSVGQKILGSFDTKGGSPLDVFETGAANPNTSDTLGGLRGASVIQGNAVDSLLAANGFGSSGGVNDTLATIRGILTNPQFQLIIQALSQKQSSDVLSAPKITTISGAQAQIRVAQEFIYPTTFTPATVTAGTSSGTGGVVTQPAITPSTPSAFASRPVGVVFNVTPMVGADGYTINLTLIPQVTDFLGFINYGNTIVNGGVTVPNDIKQPLFSTRDIMTSVEIWDGQTVMLGGLIREDLQKIDDKIPFLGDIPLLGRLFRSKTTQRNKRNLLIFVTARLVDPAGNPVHRTESASLR